MFGVVSFKNAVEIKKIDLEIGDKDEAERSAAMVERRENQLMKDCETFTKIQNEIIDLKGGLK